MLRFHKVTALAALVLFMSAHCLDARAQTLRFAWPDGASAKVRVRIDGRSVERGAESAWDISCEYKMQVQRSGGRLVVSRVDFSGWKGKLPGPFDAAGERYTDVVPTFFVSAEGAYLGMEGHDAVRKIINRSVDESGKLGPVERKALDELLSDATIESLANNYWAMLISLWRGAELDAAAVRELSTVAPVPVLEGEVEITGTARFVKEAPCAPGVGERRCVHLHAETAPDKAQVSKLLESTLKRLGASRPSVTAWDQRFKMDIVTDKANMLPQQFTVNRLMSMTMSVGGQSGSASEEVTKSYTFEWTLPDGVPKQ